MAQNADNIAIVRPKVAGAVFVGADNATMPTTAAAALTSFDSLGWLSEDGISMAINRDVTDLKGFGGDTALTIQDTHDVKFTFKPLELNEHVLKAMYGTNNVTVTSGAVTAVKLNADDNGEVSMVFDLRGRNGQLVRVCIPNAKVTDMGDMPFKHNEPMAAEWTVTAYPDSGGNKAYIYFGAA